MHSGMSVVVNGGKDEDVKAQRGAKESYCKQFKELENDSFESYEEKFGRKTRIWKQKFDLVLKF